jgi:hypothetical protein
MPRLYVKPASGNHSFAFNSIGSLTSSVVVVVLVVAPALDSAAHF